MHAQSHHQIKEVSFIVQLLISTGKEPQVASEYETGWLPQYNKVGLLIVLRCNA
jgi:hypothetical protein